MTKTTKAGADAPKAPETQNAPEALEATAAPEAAQEKHTPNAILELIRLGIEHGLIVDSELKCDSEELTRELYETVGRLNAGEDVIYLQDFCRTLTELPNTPDELDALNLFRRGFFVGRGAANMDLPSSYEMPNDLWARFWKR